MTMSAITSSLVLDVVIALLLFVTIVYCWRLSRKLALLHQGKEEMRDFINDFNSAISRADESIAQLKLLSAETDGQLKEDIQKARFLANDLAFLVEKGDNMADELEHFIADARNVARAPSIERQVQMRPTTIAPPPTRNPVPQNRQNSRAGGDDRPTGGGTGNNAHAKRTAAEIAQLLQQGKAREERSRTGASAIARDIRDIGSAATMPPGERNMLVNERNLNAVKDVRNINMQADVEMPASKRKALDEVLAQIAAKKKATTNA